MTAIPITPSLDQAPQSKTQSCTTITAVIYCPDSSVAVESTLESLLGQTYQNTEAVLVHKPDFLTSNAILEQLTNLDPNGIVRMLEVTDDATIDEAFNLGFIVARGELLLPIRAGDSLDPTTLESCVRRFTNNQAIDIVYTNSQLQEYPPPEHQADGQTFDLPDYPSTIPYPAMIRRQAWDNLNDLAVSMEQTFMAATG